MDFKTTQKKCLNNNLNTFCDKSHYIKYQKNENENVFIINTSDFIELWRHHSSFVIARCDIVCPRDTMCTLHKKLERLTNCADWLRDNNLNYDVVKKIGLFFNKEVAKTQEAFWWYDIVEWEKEIVPEGATLRWRAQFC